MGIKDHGEGTGRKRNRAISRLKDLYKDYNREGTFEYRFLDEDYQALYSARKKSVGLIKIFCRLRNYYFLPGSLRTRSLYRS